MNRFFSKIFKFSILVSFTIFLIGNNQLIAQAPINTNGSFEKSAITEGNDTSSVEGWSFNAPGFKIVEDTVKEGNRALEITVDSLNGSDPWGIEAVSGPYEINSDEYQFSIWCKSNEEGATANFTAGAPAPDFDEFMRVSKEESIGEEWTKITGTIPSNNQSVFNNTDSMRIPIHFNFEGNVGKKIYIDNLQITPPKTKKPIIVEAEEDSVGDEFEIQSMDNGGKYISITTDYDETSGTADYPGEGRIASYEISFPEAGDYDLFARIRVGPDEYNDDSFFYGNGLGEKAPGNAEDWIVMNNLAEAGFSEPGQVVRGPGGAGSETWKWVNLSRNIYQGEDSLTFSISADSLNRILQIGGREDGFDIDKFAFGHSDLYFTVENLNKGIAGSSSPPSKDDTTYAPIAKGQDKFLGNIYSSSQTNEFTEYWNQVTPENAGKWGSVESTRDEMNWGSLDAAYDLAKDNNYPFRYHVLIWGSQQPDWIDSLSNEEQLAEIKEWMQAVSERYPDIEYLEVVNEPLEGHNQPGYKEALGGDGDTGWDWVIKSFELADQYFPDSTKLMINDYNIVNDITNNVNKYLEIINLLKERDLIDAIGVQSHAFSNSTNSSTIQSSLDKLSNTGLPIQATELDIDGPTDQEQLDEYKRVFPIFWEHPHVMGVTLWGWRPGLWRDDEQAYLVNDAGEKRPALGWLRSYVDTSSVTTSIARKDNNPSKFALHNNYPNPFNPTTNIKFDIESTNQVKLTIYNIKGQKVNTLINKELSSGNYNVKWNGLNENGNRVSSGVYFYKLSSGSEVSTKKMMLLK